MRPTLLKKTARMIAMGLLVAVVGTAVTDCDEAPDAAKSANSRPTVSAGLGIVSGSVQFSAPRPEMKTIGGDCCPGSTPVLDESTLVNNNGTLKNVVVYVKAGPNVAPTNAQNFPANVDQKNCRYLPHVLAVHTGQPIDITSHDPTLHNVHVIASANPSQNFSETTVGASHRLTFAQPEVIHLKCDVHPWMSAYVSVFDHPFFATTSDDGSFKIDRLPAGTYTLVAWHEKYGMLEQSFTVTDDKPAVVTFDYRKP